MASASARARELAGKNLLEHIPEQVAECGDGEFASASTGRASSNR
jgi:hypothetical protein